MNVLAYRIEKCVRKTEDLLRRIKKENKSMNKIKYSVVHFIYGALKRKT